MADRKKLLMIAYSFPPAGGVDITRSVKFVKYLPEFGWSPVVLTATSGRYGRYDESTLDMVPEGTPVYRAPSLEWLSEGEHKGNAGRSSRRTFWDKVHIRLCLVWAWFTIPDPRVTWLPLAFLKALKIIKKEKIKDVYISGKPFSAFVLGYLIKKWANTTLTIDYRDPWTQNITYKKRTAFHDWINRKLEALVIKHSDVVIANTKINEHNMVRDFGRGLPRDKFVTIHNGFDSQDFDIETAGKFEKFTITYAGIFYFSAGSNYGGTPGKDTMQTYSPFNFFDALVKVFERRPDIKDNLEVKFMGRLGSGYDPIIAEKGLNEVIIRLGYLDYDEHIAVLKRSHALLLVLSTGEVSRGWVPSKFFQYLGSGNPVLALAGDGEVTRILDETRGGITAPPDDSEQIAEAIIRLYDDHHQRKKQIERDENEVMKYDRRHLTSLLVKALEKL